MSNNSWREGDPTFSITSRGGGQWGKGLEKGGVGLELRVLDGWLRAGAENY